MQSYSFNADLRSVFQRLAAANADGSARKPVASAKPSQSQPGAREPRVEIAHVALRRNAHDARDAVT